ncbi:hypothetical protein ECTW09195_2425, partial [Escherichia coli TW09195]
MKSNYPSEPAPLHRKSVLAVFFLNKASVTE